MIVAQLLSYQLLTMPCQACPMAASGVGECSAAGRCTSDSESDSSGGCCGGHEVPTPESICHESEVAPASSCCQADDVVPCCEESAQSPSACDSAKVEPSVTLLDHAIAMDGCKCCPISMPCDRCVALSADRPPQVRTQIEVSTTAIFADVTVDAQIIRAVAACLHPPDAGHKLSMQSLLCSWLN